jgi:hypothetical protein
VEAHLHLLEFDALVRREDRFDLAIGLLDLLAHVRPHAAEERLDPLVMPLDDLLDLLLLRIVQIEMPVQTADEDVGRKLRHRPAPVQQPVRNDADRRARDERHGQRDEGDERGLSSGHDRYLPPS